MDQLTSPPTHLFRHCDSNLINKLHKHALVSVLSMQGSNCSLKNVSDMINLEQINRTNRFQYL